MSLNQSMNISVGSMKNNQYALTVVSQNIANLHTEGYYRQKVNFVTNEYTTNCQNVLSTIRGMNGASISSLTDYVDDTAFKNLLDSNSDANYYNTLADALGELEAVADDLGDSGLNSLLNDFFKASAQLEQFPTDRTIRQEYILAAQNVCEKFNDISAKYDTIQENKFQTLTGDITRVNALLEDLAEANVIHAKHNQSPSTQADIDNIIQELSKYLDIRTDKNGNGTVNLYIGNIPAVQGGEVEFKLNAIYNQADPDTPLKLSLVSVDKPDYAISNGVNDSIKSGSIKSYVDFLNNTENKPFANVSEMKKALDSAANAFATELNKIQTQADGTTFPAYIVTQADGSLALSTDNIEEKKMFITSDNSGTINASNIKINEEFFQDPFLVSAARIDTTKLEAGEDWTKAIGNSDNAVLITALQNKNICSYNGGTNNCTLSQFLINNASKNGTDLAGIQGKADTANDIAEMEAANYAGIVGVNLDEELSDMIRYQRAFEASAKVFSTVNDLMSTILGMI